jgi:ligand-binding sensor domain-containing protein
LTSKGVIYYSTDGTKWSKVNTTFNSSLLSIANNGSKFIAAAFDGEFYFSRYGIKWTRIFNAKKKGIYNITLYKGKYIICGRDTSYIYTSKDGVKWSFIQNKLHISKFSVMGDMLYGSANNILYKTNNGTSWQKVFELPTGNINICSQDSKGYIILGNKEAFSPNKETGQIFYTSKDRFVWNLAVGTKAFFLCQFMCFRRQENNCSY